MTEEASQLITIYGSFFTQFPRFTYIRVDRYEGKPLKLPKFCLDHYILIEVCRQVIEVDKSVRLEVALATLFQLSLATTGVEGSKMPLVLRLN